MTTPAHPEREASLIFHGRSLQLLLFQALTPRPFRAAAPEERDDA